MKKFIIKATTLAGVGTLLVTGALPVNAEDTTSDGTTKDESVYVVLNADGSVSSVTVSDQLQQQIQIFITRARQPRHCRWIQPLNTSLMARP